MIECFAEDSKGLPPSYIKDIGASEGSLYGDGSGVEISCSQARTAPMPEFTMGTTQTVVCFWIRISSREDVFSALSTSITVVHCSLRTRLQNAAQLA